MDEIHHQDRTAIATNERVAVVETKIAGIEKDTGVIRATLHGINGEMQKFVILESQCVAALQNILEQTKHLPELAVKMLIFEDLKPRLTDLLDQANSRKGAWRAYTMAGSAIVGAVAIMGTISTGVVWLIERIVGR